MKALPILIFFNNSKFRELKNLNSTGDQSNVNNTNNDEPVSPTKVIETFHGSVYSLNEFEPKFYERNACLRITFGILKEMSDFTLLKQNFGFLLITLSNFFIFFGYFTPFLYITKIAVENKIDNASLLISIIGIVNIPARMAYGFIADRRFISPINLNTLSVAIGTIPLYFYFMLQYNFWTQATFAVFFAIGIGKTKIYTIS